MENCSFQPWLELNGETVVQFVIGELVAGSNLVRYASVCYEYHLSIGYFISREMLCKTCHSFFNLTLRTYSVLYHRWKGEFNGSSMRRLWPQATVGTTGAPDWEQRAGSVCITRRRRSLVIVT